VQLEVPDPDEKQKPKSYSYFCPKDSDLRGVSYSTGKSKTLINFKEVLDALDECGAGVKLVLMDACRNELKVESSTRSLDVSKFTLPEGVAAMFSCKADQKAFEAKKFEHGVFFHFVLEGLRGKAKNDRSEVTWDRLVEYVKEQVSEEVPALIGQGARQDPHAVSNLSGKSPVLALVPGKEVVKKDKDKGKDDKGGKNVVVFTVKDYGKFEVELDADKAPITVRNFLKYVDEKHYDGTVFHRVIETFMIQGGHFTKGFAKAETSEDAEKLGKKTRDEIKNEAKNGLSNTRGTIAMARKNDPDTASDQFFINVVDNSNALDPGKFTEGYAVFGKVIDGMDVIDKIKDVKTMKKAPSGHEAVPVEDVIIESVRRKDSK
jgi:peptidyl-prolyl cis-trans isomerase B (cyclophilin B)